jgi:CheY-like chemotaxis protein
MGGDITVTSTPGRGSTFRFDVAVEEGGEPDIKYDIQKRRVVGIEPGREAPRILVTEDKKDSRNLLVKLLQTVGFDVREAVNGKEAVEIFEQWRPHFIWMDIRMPVMDGLEATRRIKNSKAGKSTVVAAITAHALKEERERILAAGCDDIVRKPFREQDIFEVMAGHLGLKYVYDAYGGEEPVRDETEIKIRPEQLAALPAGLLNQLHEAVMELDTARTLELIEQVAGLDASIANVFRTLAGKLDYQNLLRLLESQNREDIKQGGTS